jgi:hypothetical protein
MTHIDYTHRSKTLILVLKRLHDIYLWLMEKKYLDSEFDDEIKSGLYLIYKKPRMICQVNGEKVLRTAGVLRNYTI